MSSDKLARGISHRSYQGLRVQVMIYYLFLACFSFATDVFKLSRLTPPSGIQITAICKTHGMAQSTPPPRTVPVTPLPSESTQAAPLNSNPPCEAPIHFDVESAPVHRYYLVNRGHIVGIFNSQ